MRSAGCIVNDIVDRKLDKKVKRTRYRPLAANLISVEKAFIYIIVLCGLAFCILIQFNFLTIFLGLASMTLAFSYPFMKRITYWPQLFLGLTFNWGIIMAWASLTDFLTIEIFLVYLAAIFWTLGYDTIYGLQDIIDDEIIGMKSTAIKFKKNIKFFVSICYSITSILILYIFFYKLNYNLLSLLILLFIGSLFYQVFIFNKKKPESCLRAFKLNNISGLILFLGILSINYS